jgi:hypothetical protein
MEEVLHVTIEEPKLSRLATLSETERPNRT